MFHRKVRAVLLGCATLALAACGDDDSTDPDLFDCESWPEIQVGQTIQGTLEQGDELDVDGAFLDRYALDLNATTALEIFMVSDDVDSFLRLRREGGQTVDSDDDSAGNFNAVVEANVAAGCYLIDATTFEGESGDYLLSVNPPAL